MLCPSLWAHGFSHEVTATSNRPAFFSRWPTVVSSDHHEKWVEFKSLYHIISFYTCCFCFYHCVLFVYFFFPQSIHSLKTTILATSTHGFIRFRCERCNSRMAHWNGFTRRLGAARHRGRVTFCGWRLNVWGSISEISGGQTFLVKKHWTNTEKTLDKNISRGCLSSNPLGERHWKNTDKAASLEGKRVSEFSWQSLWH